VKERPRRAPNWAMVFNNLPDEPTIMATYHQLAKKYHPDNGGSTEIMQAILLFEPGRYPVVYFPETDVASHALERTDHAIQHPDLGPTS
jgi:uncharacterized protein (DUF427 family)